MQYSYPNLNPVVLVLSSKQVSSCSNNLFKNNQKIKDALSKHESRSLVAVKHFFFENFPKDGFCLGDITKTIRPLLATTGYNATIDISAYQKDSTHKYSH